MLLLAFHFSLLTSSCSSRSTSERAQAEAMAAAEDYCQSLLEGRMDDYLDGRVGAAGLTEGYREQLMAACRQFVAQQQRAHDGIVAVKALRAVPDSAQLSADAGEALPLMQVFMQISYGDDTQEEIVMPLVSHGGSWLMK